MIGGFRNPDSHWHRRMWHLAWPIMLSNVSHSLLGAVDTGVMGRLPDPAYIGGVAVGSVILSYFLWVFGFLRMATTGLTAQAFGARDGIELRALVIRSLLLALGLGLFFILFRDPMGDLAYGIVGASARVTELGRAYYDIRIWGLPGALGIFAVTGWLIGIQRTVSALVLQVAYHALNVVLDLLFVIGFGWGVEGVALGTLISEYAGLALGGYLVLRHLGTIPAGLVSWATIGGRRLLALMAVNGNIFIRSFLIVSAHAYMTVLSAQFGDVVLAANAILILFNQFLAQALDGFAFATEALVGQAVGARSRDQYRNAVAVGALWSVVFAAGFTALFALGGGTIIDALAEIESVRAAARDYLFWIVAMPLIIVWSYLLDGIFIGATRSAEMRDAMILTALIYAAALWILIPLWGNHGLWLSYLILSVARTATLMIYYPRITRSFAEMPAQAAAKP
jgi:MATE family multidrug resistance protein